MLKLLLAGLLLACVVAGRVLTMTGVRDVRVALLPYKRVSSSLASVFLPEPPGP